MSTEKENVNSMSKVDQVINLLANHPLRYTDDKKQPKVKVKDVRVSQGTDPEKRDNISNEKAKAEQIITTGTEFANVRFDIEVDEMKVEDKKWESSAEVKDEKVGALLEMKSYIEEDTVLTDTVIEMNAPSQMLVSQNVVNEPQMKKQLTVKCGCFTNIFMGLIAPIILAGFLNENIFTYSNIHTDIRCLVPECGDTNSCSPYDTLWLSAATDKCSQCFNHRSLKPNRTSCTAADFTNTTVRCDKHVYKSYDTLNFEFDTGCDDLKEYANIFKYLGMVAALPIVFRLSDLRERHPCLVSCMLANAMGSTIKIFSPDAFTYYSSDYFKLGGVGLFPLAYIYVMEMMCNKCDSKKREQYNALCWAFLVFGQGVLGVVAYHVRPWRCLVAALLIPYFFVFPNILALPVDVRRLPVQNAQELVSMVKYNTEKKNGSNKSGNKRTQSDKASFISKMWKLMKLPKLIQRFLVTSVMWIAVSCTQRSFSETLQYSIIGVFSETNLYMCYATQCLIDLIGVFFAYVLTLKNSRTDILPPGFSLCGVCIWGIMFSARNWIRLVFNVIGQISVSVVLSTLYLVTLESYPKSYRGTVFGLSIAFGPLTYYQPIAYADYFGFNVPAGAAARLYYGLMSFVAALLVYFLPETRGVILPNTVKQAENVGNPRPKLEVIVNE